MIPDLPNMPDLPLLESTAISKPARTALPAVGSEFTMSSGRQAEAEEFARAMGQGFAITRAQNKRQQAKSRAKGRQTDSAAKKQGKSAKKQGSGIARERRESTYALTRNVARSMGVDSNLFKKAKL